MSQVARAPLRDHWNCRTMRSSQTGPTARGGMPGGCDEREQSVSHIGMAPHEARA